MPAAVHYSQASRPPSPEAPVPVLGSLRLASLPSEALTYGRAASHEAAAQAPSAAAAFRDARTPPDDTAAEAIFREARARSKAEEGQQDSEESKPGMLLGRWRTAALRNLPQAEQIRVKEEDFHRYGGNLELLRRHQVPPAASKPPKLTFKEAFEQSCREHLSPRDPWNGLPNPEKTRPPYESDLILNQVVPRSPTRYEGRATVPAMPRTVPATPRALAQPAANSQPRVPVTRAGLAAAALSDAACTPRTPPSSAPRPAGRGSQPRRSAVDSAPLPQIRIRPRKQDSW